MSEDAPASRRSPLAVCWLSVSPLRQISRFEKVAETLRVHRDDIAVWLYTPSDSTQAVSQTDMPISDIPTCPRFPAVPLSSRLALAYRPSAILEKDDWICHYPDPENVVRPIADFKYFVLARDRLIDHAYLHEILSVNPSARILTDDGEFFDPSRIIPLPGVRRVVDSMIRNTYPLLRHAKTLLTTPKERERDHVRFSGPLTAVEAQVLMRSARVRLTFQDHKDLKSSLRILASEGLIKGDITIHRYATSDAVPTPLGEALIATLHPSAYDPGFLDRWRDWCADPERHAEQQDRWIRTWSGRLRRHQAKIWKASVPAEASAWVSQQMSDAMSTGEVFFLRDKAEALSEARPDIGGRQTVAAIIVAEMGKVPRDVFVSKMTRDGDRVYGPPAAFH